MLNKLFKLVMLLCVIGLGYYGWRTYHYFFDKHKPEVALIGVKEGGWYADEVQCSLEGSDAYKVADISIWLDDKPLIRKHKVDDRRFSHPFTIATRPLPNGKHKLRLQVANGTRRQATAEQTIFFNVDNTQLQAAFVKPDSDCKVFQGRTLHLQFQVNKDLESAHVKALGSSYPCFKEAPNSKVYECFIPVDCEEKPNEYLVTVEVEDKVGNTLTLDQRFQVVFFPFKKQTLRVPPEKVEAERKAGLSAQQLDQEIERLTAESPQEKLWQGSFVTPIEITRVTTDYGVIRTTQERGRYMHKAVDVINAPKSVVWATQDGIVVLKDRYEFSGNTVIVDHGYGILSLFFHLDTFADINVGEKIKRGNPVGTLGKTGYADGYHLHWEMRIGNMAIDPMQWVKPGF